LISDSALKVVLSYYPVCRCQRTSPELLRGKHSRPFQITKKLNLGPDRPAFAKATAGKRDKIESNLQSQMYVERPRTHSGPASSGTTNLAQIEPPSTLVLLISGEKCLPRMQPFSRDLRGHSLGERLHPNGGIIWNGETDIQFARLQRERLACGHATH